MATASVLAFWLVAVALIVVPGADWAFTIGAGLRGRYVTPAVGGLIVGYAAVTIVVAAGAGALVAASPPILTGLSIVGGCYLMWHGATTFARPSTLDSENGPARTGWRVFIRGIGVSGLNPKGLLLFLALLPQFTDPREPWPIASQIGVLGLVFMGTCAVFYLGIGSLARTILRARPVVARTISRASGAAMVLIGAVLVVERLIG